LCGTLASALRALNPKVRRGFRLASLTRTGANKTKGPVGEYRRAFS
jgi:hypothetical protein